MSRPKRAKMVLFSTKYGVRVLSLGYFLGSKVRVGRNGPAPLQSTAFTVLSEPTLERTMATSKRTTSSRSKKSTRSKHERMDALLAAIANPPAPTAKLVAALKLHRQHCG